MLCRCFADVPGCLFAYSLSSLPHRRRAHLLLFSPTLSNVNSHTEASWTPREYCVPIPVFKIKYFRGLKAVCSIKSVRCFFRSLILLSCPQENTLLGALAVSLRDQSYNIYLHI